MTLLEPAARNSYETTLLHNLRQGRQANEQLVRAFESYAARPTLDISPLVVSHDRVTRGVDALGATMSQVSETMGALLSVVGRGFADLAYQQRLTNDTLREIVEVLQAPLDTSAKELRRRAEEAYRNGWIEDARKDFLESEERNRYDFTVHHALGTIAYLHTSEPQEARREFELAARYARPKSSLDAAYALVAGASVEEELKALDAALALAEDAVEAANGALPEAYYARGRYRLAVGRDKAVAVADLETAFWGNPALALASMDDQILKNSRTERDQALDRFRSGLAAKVAERAGVFGRRRNELSAVTFKHAPNVFAPVVRQIDEALRTISVLEARNSIVDYLEALQLLGRAERDLLEAAKRVGTDAVRDARAEAQALRAEDASRVQRMQDATAWARSGSVQTSCAVGLAGTAAVCMLIIWTAWSGIWEGIFAAVYGLIGGAIVGWLIGYPIGAMLKASGSARVKGSMGSNPQIASLEATANAIEAALPSQARHFDA